MFEVVTDYEEGHEPIRTSADFDTLDEAVAEKEARQKDEGVVSVRIFDRETGREAELPAAQSTAEPAPAPGSAEPVVAEPANQP